MGAQLHLKGYTKPSSGHPDFYVAYHSVVNNMTLDSSTQYFSEGMAGHPFTYSADTRTMGKKPQATASDTPSYMAGALLIDVIDAA